MPLDSNTFVTRKEAAEITRISIDGIDRLILRGELEAKHFGRRVVILRSSLERFVRKDHFQLIESKAS